MPSGTAPAPRAAAPPTPAPGNERARKISEKFFAPYTWAQDQAAAVGAAQRKELGKQIDKLTKATSQLKPSDPRRAEAERLLGVMRGKAKEAAQREGRYTKKTVAVDEAEAKLDGCDDAQEVLQARMNKLGRSMVKNVEELHRLQELFQGHHETTASAGRAAAQVANEVLAGDPDDPMEEPAGEPAEDGPPTKGHAESAVASGSRGDEVPVAPERAAAGEPSARTCCVVLGRGSKRAGQVCGKALPCKRHQTQGSAQAAASQPPAPRAGGARAGAKRPRGTTPDSAAKQGALHYGAFSPRPGSTLKRRRGGVAAGGDAAEPGRENPFGLFTGEIKHMALLEFCMSVAKFDDFWPGRTIRTENISKHHGSDSVRHDAPFPMVSQGRRSSPATPRATTAATQAPRRAQHSRRSHRRLAPHGG